LEGGETEWLWENYIPKSAISGIAGPSDTGKSTLLRQLALAIASRKDNFLGNKLSVSKGRVIYVSTEDSANGLKQSLQKQIESLEIPEHAFYKIAFLFDQGKVVDDLDKMMQKYGGVDLIILDSMGDTFEGNPNDFVSVRQYLRGLNFLTAKYGCAILLLHHNVKNSENGAPNKNNLNGSQGLEAKMRSLFEVRKGSNADERLLTILKGNYVAEDLKRKSRVLKFDESALIYLDEGKHQDIKGGTNNTGKYDRDLWVKRFNEFGAGQSYSKTIDRLRAQFDKEDVPGKTWFVENLKNKEQGENKIVSRIILGENE
jgi:hypothetical protein